MHIISYLRAFTSIYENNLIVYLLVRILQVNANVMGDATLL